ncbi:Card1-like endonuclease domain-containing protein [Mucilaginibacter terrae]|uniref:Card1 endonuclease domain-containing protein n=1 Tax=Mucilaginibacter terrae TaxID=1955052 RepID=A0ABU3GVI0_9SPHI|nr:DUF1887 family CARF protein [Mucilaginibacter terrae]MDT3403783.1 hypothetical protein [Mucilaginibacter terrae]
MAKHQIALVGGQILPIYFGIKEFAPDHIHFIVSAESQGKSAQIRHLIGPGKVAEYTCNPYEISSIKSICEKIIRQTIAGDEVLFNLTGGNKVMLLAAQAVMNEHSFKGVYINQNETVLHLPEMTEQPLSCTVTTAEFIQLTGHQFSGFKKITDISTEDFRAAEKINDFAIYNEKAYLKILPAVSRNFKTFKDVPVKGTLEINAGLSMNWSEKNVQLTLLGKNVLNVTAPSARELLFRAAWWELIVAEQIKKWVKVKELLLHCELPFKGDKTATKNEIDILLNVGRKMIFVECKSGAVKQEDINKMKIVKDTYGGFIAKSILVSRFTPPPGIIEKCKELNVELCVLRQGLPANTLITALDKLNKRLSI